MNRLILMGGKQNIISVNYATVFIFKIKIKFIDRFCALPIYYRGKNMDDNLTGH